METTTRKPADVPAQATLLARQRRGCLWLALFFVLALGPTAHAERPQFVPGQILVKPKAAVAEDKLAGKLHERGAVQRRTIRHLNVRVMAVPEEKAEAVLAALRDDPDIEFAERDFFAEAAFVPNDTYAASEWHLARIQAQQAWDNTAGRTNAVVAVLDSGINAAHPDFAGQLLPGHDFINNTPTVDDDFGHGTAVAGTIAAAGHNGIGVAGVAFGCRVMPVKVMDASGFAAYSTIAQGIKYAVDQGARVINLSVAGSSPSSTLQDAINYAWSNNVVVVAAAGNNATSTPQYPAACNHVVSVSATAPDDTLASFSSYGYITLAAPGDNIWTTQRNLNNPYGAWRGTSFASPVLAAVAALVASVNPTLSGDQIVSLLESTADDLGTIGYDASFGYGRVNALKAVNAASAAPGALPPGPPPGPVTNLPPADINPPVVALTQAPKDGARVTTSQVLLAGTAADDVGVQKIQVDVNGTVQPAEGAANWSAAIDLAAGTNFIQVRSVDFAGNRSPAVTLTVACIVNVPLAVETNGWGSVTPRLDGSLLEIGKAYTVRAVPGRGQVFAGWSGVASPSPALKFIMQSNLVLTANFVPSPFPPVKGTYAGLATDTNGITPQSSGYFTVTVSSSGAFSGRLLLGGRHHGFRGQFDLGGDAVVTVNRGPLLGPLRLTLHVDLENNTNQVWGWLTDGAWVSAVSGDRNIFNSRRNPAAQAGLRNFILQRTDDTAIAAATGRISKGGSASVRGRLEDGRSFGAASLLGKNGDYPFYLSLSRGSEVVIGWLNFPMTANPTASGTVLWVRTGTNAFAATLQAASAP